MVIRFERSPFQDFSTSNSKYLISPSYASLKTFPRKTECAVFNAALKLGTEHFASALIAVEKMIAKTAKTTAGKSE